MSFNDFVRFFICISIALNLGCIHTKSHEFKSIELADENSRLSGLLQTENIQVKSVIYTAEKFPLEDFFSQLLKGQFKESFKRANLAYKPSNTENEIMKNLLNRGLVPVYIVAMNTGKKEIKFSYEQFYLVSEGQRHQTFNPVMLPTQIREFSPAAVAANIHNVMVVTTVTFMLGLLLSGIPGNPSFPNYSNGTKSEQKDIFNRTQKITHVDYKNYVIKEKTLKPGEEVSGLLFFNLADIQTEDARTLEFKEVLQFQ